MYAMDLPARHSAISMSVLLEFMNHQYQQSQNYCNIYINQQLSYLSTINVRIV